MYDSSGLRERGITEVDVAIWRDVAYRAPFYSCDAESNLTGELGRPDGKTITELRESGIAVNLVTSEDEIGRVRKRYAAKPDALKGDKDFMEFQQSRIVPLSLEDIAKINAN